MSMLKVDLDLIKKYNVPGPRYTSYPPATQFAGEFAPETFVEKIRANNRADQDLSLYFHLPFCQTLCLRLHDRHHHRPAQERRLPGLPRARDGFDEAVDRSAP